MAGDGAHKYASDVQYLGVKLSRAALRAVIGDLARWEPLEAPRDGYTVIIGCNVPLARMLSCNLQFLARQRLDGVDRVLVVMDRPRDRMPDDVEPAMRQRFPGLPLEFLYYTPTQRAVCSLVRWPWVQSWLSWSLGIAAARTRHALLHDFDAMLLRPDIVEDRYRAIRERGHEYVGIRNYEGNGVLASDGLVTTFELMFDAAFVRSSFRPIDLFNHVMRHGGRRVDFDTFLYAQTLRGTASVLPIPEDDLVHPSQMICQFEYHRTGSAKLPPSNNLLLIPYFLYAGGEPAVLRELTLALERSHGAQVPFFGRQLDLSGLDPRLLLWHAKQAYRIERVVADGVRPDVMRYFAAADAVTAGANRRDLVLGADGTLPAAVVRET